MIKRVLRIGRWTVDFRLAPDGYDTDAVLESLYDLGANARDMRKALDIMEGGAVNMGFTFPNPYERTALVVIGPASSGEEFVDTLVHEIHHVAVAIADGLGIDLDSETPAYLAGDAARDLAEVICGLGCPRCGG